MKSLKVESIHERNFNFSEKTREQVKNFAISKPIQQSFRFIRLVKGDTNIQCFHSA